MPHACGETMYKFDLGASGLRWGGGPCTVLRGEASCPGASPTCSRLLLPRQRPVHGVGEGFDWHQDGEGNMMEGAEKA